MPQSPSDQGWTPGYAALKNNANNGLVIEVSNNGVGGRFLAAGGGGHDGFSQGPRRGCDAVRADEWLLPHTHSRGSSLTPAVSWSAAASFVMKGEVEKKKIRRLPLRKGVNVRPVLVYVGELAPSVEGTGYFDAIVDASSLLD